jgi:glycyl-tRNA synthetase beta chain
MAHEHELLIEIGCEEIPVEDQLSLMVQIKESMHALLTDHQIAHQDLQVFSTPRRLVIICSDIDVQQESTSKDIIGPPYKVAFDEQGNPTQAALKFADTCKTSVDKLRKIETKKGVYLTFKQHTEGATTAGLLPDILKELFSRLTFKKGMYWDENKFIFTRPVRWLMVMIDSKVVPLEIAGIESSNVTRGHRFLGDSYIEVAGLEHYLKVIQDNYVLISNQSRKLLILNQMQEILQRVNAKIREDEELLQYAVHSVEYPLVILCSFPVEFLSLPEEILITCLKEHQKAFVLEDADGKLLPHFIVVANVNQDDLENIKTGNEKIAIARLKDATFFWEEDKKTGLNKLKQTMTKIIFQGEKGTVLDKINRVTKLVKYLSSLVGFAAAEQLLAAEAVELAKCDLASKTVGEFPTMQGKLGGLLCREEKISKDIAQAVYEQYLPLKINDPLPSTKMGALVALADKFDNLCIGFAHSLELSGSKDPYGLRRNAIAICRILIEYPFFISINDLIENYVKLLRLSTPDDHWIQELKVFIVGRFKSIAEQQNFRYDIINSILTIQNDDLHDAWQRLLSINEIINDERFQKLVSASKRVTNILKGQKSQLIVDTSLFQQDEETILYQEWLVLKEEWNVYLRLRNYTSAFSAMKPLCITIDKFFDNVLVMDENDNVKNNRIALLYNIYRTFLNLLDLSEIVIPGKTN